MFYVPLDELIALAFAAKEFVNATPFPLHNNIQNKAFSEMLVALSRADFAINQTITQTKPETESTPGGPNP